MDVVAAERFATAGDLFANGIIDLVRNPRDSSKLKLVLWDRSRAIISSHIEVEENTYEPVQLEPTVVRTFAWPTAPIEYKSTRRLFEEILSTIAERIEMPESHSRVLTSAPGFPRN
jgi:hypothetical protein